MLGGILAVADGWKGIFYVLAGFAALLICAGLPLKESLIPQNRFKGHLLGHSGISLADKNKRFVIHALLKGTALGLLFAYCSSAPFIIQDEHFGWSELDFGLFMGFNAIFIACGAMTALKFDILKKAAFIGGWTLMLLPPSKWVFYSLLTTSGHTSSYCFPCFSH